MSPENRITKKQKNSPKLMKLFQLNFFFMISQLRMDFRVQIYTDYRKGYDALEGFKNTILETGQNSTQTGESDSY